MKYILVLFYLSTTNVPAMHSVGPFDNLIACEKAASMTEIAALESGMRRPGTVCVGTKDYAFAYKEPKK